LPDHAHEGAVKLPENLVHKDTDGRLVWPIISSVQPQPEVVAWGINYASPLTFARRVPLVVAYDGHAVRVGNIVAHSTWHHFTNVNLVGFLDGATATATLRRIGEYYANIANYLDNPFTTRIRFFDNIVRGIKFRSPVSDDPGFGGGVLHKNPIQSREELAKENGRLASRHLHRLMSPQILRYRLLDQLRSEFVQHGIDLKLVNQFDLDIVLGEILAIYAEKFGDSLDQIEGSSDLEREGIRRALEYYVKRQDKLLEPLRRAIN
jgi:hypothetical protein